MTKAIRTSSIRMRDVFAYTAMALCFGLGMLVLLLGERVNALL